MAEKKTAKKHITEQQRQANVEAAAQNLDTFEDTPLAFVSPESSSIYGAQYDPNTEMLSVDFRRNPALPVERYTYSGFPLEKWREFLAAESKGTYFAKWIRPLFSGKVQKNAAV